MAMHPPGDDDPVSVCRHAWSFDGRPLDKAPVWMANAEASLRRVLIERSMAQASLDGTLAHATGEFGPHGSPMVSVRLEAEARLLVVPLPSVLQSAVCGPGTGHNASCDCVSWWRSRTGAAEGLALLVAELAGLAPKHGFVIIALPHTPLQGLGVGLVHGLLQANPALSADRLVVCVMPEQELGFGLGPAYVTDAPPLLVAAAIRRFGYLAIGFNQQPGAILCDNQSWDGAGLDCRIRDFLPGLGPTRSPWLWAYGQRRGKHVTTGCCPGFLARCLSAVAQIEQSDAPTQELDTGTQSGETLFPCLCGANVLQLPSADPSRATIVTTDVVDRIDDAATGAGVQEVLVLVDPINPANGTPTSFAPWLGPCRASIVFVTTRLASLRIPDGAQAFGPAFALPGVGRWTSEPCPRCLQAGEARGGFSFIEAMERAIDEAPYKAGQSPCTRLPFNYRINDWLRFGCATTALNPYELQVRPGAPPVQVLWVLVDPTDPARRPLRLVLVDARSHRMDPELWAVIRAQLGSCDGATVGFLWCDGTLQPGLAENSTLRFV